MFDITPIREEHVESFHRTLDEVAKEQPYLGIECAPPADYFKEQIVRCIEERHPFLVATRGNVVIGWCSVTPFPQPRYRFTGQLFVGVLHEWRGLGVGTSLLRDVLNTCWATELHRVELEVCVANETATRLYRKFGFIDEGIRRSAYFLDGKFEDIRVMSILRAAPIKHPPLPKAAVLSSSA